MVTTWRYERHDEAAALSLLDWTGSIQILLANARVLFKRLAAEPVDCTMHNTPSYLQIDFEHAVQHIKLQ